MMADTFSMHEVGNVGCMILLHQSARRNSVVRMAVLWYYKHISKSAGKERKED